MRRRGLLGVGVALVAAGCMTTAPTKPPAVDVTGRWAGTWLGYGIVDIPREERATADLTQKGARGYGTLALSGTGAADSVPMAIRQVGSGGTRVTFEVSGSDVT
ncbi:MAG: hypothetical protein HY728_08315, partial [Candidatus Rokubacteria bacterium]|nr:hypothetical protein [Candidatus Rokubacteria bacterium]